MNTPASAQTPERILLRLDWNVVRRLDGLLQGDYRSLFYGLGVDFADLREYQPQDDIRYIDWNVTARMDTPYVRQYHEDRDITAWFLLDMSPSVDFGTLQTQVDKRTMLIDFVTVIARLLTRHGNRVGALIFGVAAYVTVIAVMVACATGWGNAWAVVGAWLFFASDALIGETRFVRPHLGHAPRARLAVIVTYHLGQAGLVLSLVHR